MEKELSEPGLINMFHYPQQSRSDQRKEYKTGLLDLTKKKRINNDNK